MTDQDNIAVIDQDVDADLEMVREQLGEIAYTVYKTQVDLAEQFAGDYETAVVYGNEAMLEEVQRRVFEIGAVQLGLDVDSYAETYDEVVAFLFELSDR